MIAPHLKRFHVEFIAVFEESYGLEFSEACAAKDILNHCFNATFLEAYYGNDLRGFLDAVLGNDNPGSAELRARMIAMCHRGLEGQVDLPLLAKSALAQEMVRMGFEALSTSTGMRGEGLDEQTLRGKLSF